MVGTGWDLGTPVRVLGHTTHALGTALGPTTQVQTSPFRFMAGGGVFDTAGKLIRSGWRPNLGSVGAAINTAKGLGRGAAGITFGATAAGSRGNFDR
jgi:hypothetical protein